LGPDLQGAHGEVDGHHEIDFTASANVVSESVQRNCPVEWDKKLHTQDYRRIKTCKLSWNNVQDLVTPISLNDAPQSLYTQLLVHSLNSEEMKDTRIDVFLLSFLHLWIDKVEIEHCPPSVKQDISRISTRGSDSSVTCTL
jgi:hypothetical protein